MESGTVLYVDDDPDFADLVGIRLRRELDDPVETTTTAEGGLERLEAGGVACLVLDYRMPRMTGPELLEAVTERHPGVPAVFFTGIDDPETAAEAKAAGASAFVRKDVRNFGTLADAVREADGGG